ncbi:MAG TPA: ABC transporter substrate-binding protein [Stellaceae bacterium]|nr:ABC transporter substrate-binding protein [Stellaceae bacterium]
MAEFSRREFIALSSALALAPELARAAAPTAGQRGGTVIVAFGVGTPRHLNPAVQSGVATAVPGTQIFASPLRYDALWKPHPYLAKSWSVAPDGLSVTLDLVDDAVFHDGHPVTSADVAYSILAIKKDHPFKDMFAPVERVETPDPHTAIIRLAHRHPAILLALSPALCPILPKHYFDDGTDLKINPKNSKPIGCGPFKLVEFVPGNHITLERFDKYFIPGRPYLDRMILQIINDATALVIGMQQHQTHVNFFASEPRDIARLSKEPSLAVTDQGYAGIGPINWLEFNLLKKPLDDKRVRQAIAYALDRNFIINSLLLGKARAAIGPIAPDSPFYTADVNHYAVDLKKANALLDAAGLKRGADGTRFALTVDYIPGPSVMQQGVAQYLKPQLKKIGIAVDVRAAPDFPTWAQRVSSWDFDMSMDVVFNWGDPVIGVDRTYLSSNIRKGVIWSNTQNYRNPMVDKLLETAATEIDPAKRKAQYVEFQKIVVDDAPIAYVNVVPYYTIYDKGLANIPTSIWGSMSAMDELYWQKKPA